MSKKYSSALHRWAELDMNLLITITIFVALFGLIFLAVFGFGFGYLLVALSGIRKYRI